MVSGVALARRWVRACKRVASQSRQIFNLHFSIFNLQYVLSLTAKSTEVLGCASPLNGQPLGSREKQLSTSPDANKLRWYQASRSTTSKGCTWTLKHRL